MGVFPVFFCKYSKISLLQILFMKNQSIFITLIFCSFLTSAQQLKVTGGLNVTKGNIDADVLNEIIQQKQEEVFMRLFQNIVVDYFDDDDPTTGLYNFPTYYGIYNIMSDITIGKSKTTASKAVINSMTEFAFMYSYVKYYEAKVVASAIKVGDKKRAEKLEENKLENIQIVRGKGDKDGGRTEVNKDRLLRLNFYMEAAFDVLANSEEMQEQFTFKHPITSTEMAEWYKYYGLLNDTNYTEMSFTDVDGTTRTLAELHKNMKDSLSDFLKCIKDKSLDKKILALCSISKTPLGLENITEDQVTVVKLFLNEFANKSDFLFDRNVVKQLFNLLVENTHFGTDDVGKVNEVYVDIESLILSLDKEFVNKQKSSSVSARLFFINPRPFITIGTSMATFIDNSNRLDKNDSGQLIPMKNVSLATEKIGFRVTLYDRGYTSSFSPGETYKWHGRNYTWSTPQKRPLVYSVYYNIYASGLLYNVLNVKTNKNFDYGFIGSNLGMKFFNGLELSAGVACIWDGGLESRNVFAKFDFDVPIVDYLMALKKKKENK